MPRFLELERTHRSLILGLRAGRAGQARAASGARYALFVAPADGMAALVDAIARRLPEGAVRTGARGDRTSRATGGGWHLRAGGDPLAADAVIVATPACAAAELLGAARRDARADARRDRLRVVRDRDARLPERRRAARRAPASASSSRRSSAARSSPAPTRAGSSPTARPRATSCCARSSAARSAPTCSALDDATLIATVRRELRALLGIDAAPLFVRVQRHPRAMPQYAVGHLDRVAAIEARAAALPGLALAGAAYRGVGRARLRAQRGGGGGRRLGADTVTERAELSLLDGHDEVEMTRVGDGAFYYGFAGDVRRLIAALKISPARRAAHLLVIATQGKVNTQLLGKRGPGIGNRFLVARLLHVALFSLRAARVDAIEATPVNDPLRLHYQTMGFVNGELLRLTEDAALTRAFEYIEDVYASFRLDLSLPPLPM